MEKITFKEGLAMASIASGFVGAVLLLAKVSEIIEREGKRLDMEWQLKYDINGEPRPEYWGDRIQEEYKRIEKMRIR